MSDEPVIHEDADVLPIKRMPTIHKGNARELALKKAALDSEKRAETQKQRRIAAMSAMGNVAEQADIAAANKSLDLKSNEELADMAVRRMAKIVLLGGEAFAPVTLREASEAANSWANIAYKEAQKRKGTADTASDDESPAEQAAKALRQIRTDLAKKKAAG
jgi:hypothetical protein